jgi:hypothetical protein
MEKKTFIRMTLTTVVVVLSLTLNAQTEKIDLSANGGFEDEVMIWEGKGIIDKVDFKDGKGSLKLEGGANCMYVQQNITKRLKPSTEYVLSVDIKRTPIKEGAVYAAVLTKPNPFFVRKTS